MVSGCRQFTCLNETMCGRTLNMTRIDPRPSKTIAISLSGGGSRAIAFHLGCLRALQDLGILERAQVISAVSGGAVIAGMYCYSDESFENFDARVVALLRKGLQWSIVKRMLLPRRMVHTVMTLAAAGFPALVWSLIAFTCKVMRLVGIRWKWTERCSRLQPPLRRWSSRSSAFEDALRAELFGDTTLPNVQRKGLDVVINACELRTGTAFRFCNIRSSCWRFGTVSDNNISVAQAVAASASFPIALPAFDRTMTFLKNGVEYTERVILTDGGVYDNLGTTPLEPLRDSSFSDVTFDVGYIVSCDAGHGQWEPNHIAYGWAKRMHRVVLAMFRLQPNGTRKLLFEYVRNGTLRGFVYSYLGQMDNRLPLCPPDLIAREEVISYGTSFAAMPEADIERLVRRGEQLTRLLVAHYCPDM